MSKCNKTEDEEEYGPNVDGPPIIDTMFAKSPADFSLAPPPPTNNLSCSNPDLIQVMQLPRLRFWQYHGNWIVKAMWDSKDI